jgi:hypothetical protein
MRVSPLLYLLVCLLPTGEGFGQTGPPTRVVESVVPWLDYSSSCWSVVELQNLGNREVSAEVEAHKSTGALAPLVGHSGIQVRLRVGERVSYKLQVPEGTTGAWVQVREEVPSPLSPVLAVSGATECQGVDELHSTVREVAWPTRNPWFSGNVSARAEGVIALINTSEHPALVWRCYSSGALYSVPHKDGSAGELTPVCSETIQDLIPPFGSQRFPMARAGNSHLVLTTRGNAIILQVLQPEGTNVKIFRVDSTIKFGEEVSHP